MNARYYIAIFFVMVSSLVYGPRVDLSDGSDEPAPTWIKGLVILFCIWVVFVYMRDQD